MGPRNAEETAAFELITRSVMNTLWKLFFGRSLTYQAISNSVERGICEYDGRCR